MLDCAQAVAEKLNPKDPGGALRALADRIQQDNAEPRLPETYPADWPKLRDVYVGLLAQEQTRQVRDRRREMLSLASTWRNVVADSRMLCASRPEWRQSMPLRVW